MRLPAMTDVEFSDFIDAQVPDNPTILKYLITTRNKLREYQRIAVSYSGGSDSDIVIDLIELVKPPDCGKICYIFVDTGLEWDATKKHVKDTADEYGVDIETRKAYRPIPSACKEYGIPFISKDCSDKINRLQTHGFQFDSDMPDIIPGCRGGSTWWRGERGSRFSITNMSCLKEYMMLNPPTFLISSKCCEYSKKKTAALFDKEFHPDLKIDGQRRSEGGIRASTYHSCFTPSGTHGAAKYRPLFFWDDATKQEYKQWRNILYSDCYEVWGFQRTGCLGCPCSSRAEEDLRIAEQYEPLKVRAAYAVFGQSYEYRRGYTQFKEACKKEKRKRKGDLT